MRFKRAAQSVAAVALLLVWSGTGLAAGKPDLGVTELTNPPATGVAGDTFSVTAAVKNRGASPAAASTTVFSLLSQDGKTQIALQGIQIVPALAAGVTSAVPATVAIPHDVSGGVFFLQACADGLGAIAEAGETNNCRKSREKIAVQPRPDLVVTALGDPPAAVAPGGTFTVSTSVKNTGSVQAGASTTKYALVDAASAVTELTSAQAVPVLGPGSTFTDDETLTVPPGIALGLYRLRACADAATIVTEGDEADNCRLSAGTVTVTDQPDLVVSAAAISNAPVAITPGGSIAIEATVTNTGVARADASRLSFALVNSSGGRLRALAETQDVRALDPGESASSQTTVTVGTDIPIGTYRAQVCVDAGGAVPEAADDNNCATATGTVSVQTVVVLKPDLLVTALTSPPESAVLSQSFTVKATITNRGSAAAIGTTTKLYLVPTTGTGKKNLKGVQTVGPLDPGKSEGSEVTVKVYSDTVPNTYTLQACADGNGDVAESIENNNCATAQGTIRVLDSPDLAVIAVSNPPGTATQGQSIPVTATVKNVGKVSSIASTTRYYLVATDGSGKIDLKGKPPVPALDPNDTFTEKDSVTVRPETSPGKYTLQACADSGKAVAEKNEDNNCLASTGIITVTPRPNLVTTAVVLTDPAPIAVGLGGIINLQFTVQNLGEGPATGSQMRFFLVDPTSPLTKDLKGHPSVSSLASTKSTTVKGSVTVFGDTKPGTYGIRGCADYNEQVPEVNEDDNCAMATGTVTVHP